MDVNGPESPTAMQRLELAEGEMSRMSGDISSLISLGHQQQQQIQLQGEMLTQVMQMLTNLAPPSAQPAPAPTPSAPALPHAPAPMSSPPADTTPEPRIGHPERFDGNQAQVRAFLTSCRLQFSLQPRTFATEGAKVGYTITHLTGRARLWGTAEFDRQTPACASFAAFEEEMLKVFDLGSSTSEANGSLMTIRQGRRTVADYSIDFRTLARRSSWNMAAQVDAFLHSLADYLKDELVSHDEPKTLDEAIGLVARIDRRIQIRRREKGRSIQPSVRNLRDSAAQSPPVTTHSRLDPPEPMEIGRASLSTAERQRRLSANLCLYCGADGHRVSTCPAKAGAHRI